MAFARRMLISSTKSAATIISPRYFRNSSCLMSRPFVVRPKGVTFTCCEELNCWRGLSSFGINHHQQQQHEEFLQQMQNVLYIPTEKPIFVDFWKVSIDIIPKGMSRDEIIDIYINCLASVLGSEDEARKKMHSVSTRFGFFFVCSTISPQIIKQLQNLPSVSSARQLTAWEITDVSCTGEPFINGQPVPYDPKYYAFHEERMRACHMNRRFAGQDAPRVPHSRRGVTSQKSDPNFGNMSLVNIPSCE